MSESACYVACTRFRPAPDAARSTVWQPAVAYLGIYVAVSGATAKTAAQCNRPTGDVFRGG